MMLGALDKFLGYINRQTTPFMAKYRNFDNVSWGRP